MGEFKQDLFGCFGNGQNCCCSFFCPCIPIGKTAEKLGYNFVICCLSGVIFPWGPAIYLREKVREQNNINGSLFEDILTGFFCTCCSIAQTSTEVEVFIAR
ncbi:Protein PLANT CADMIUM RESISTANCE 2 [Thelohanellus kitauei]|uniref:Protein PLANT CADMIUM RESISTANCE 2 n=1 Tax=Thelohanellus kitauei TaxID=669202 RepID=A0A0C2MGM0_THEKT|nr:Protein PLANT CADMIUM RESISTANCE 2 [Thelohanellus kitauei]